MMFLFALAPLLLSLFTLTSAKPLDSLELEKRQAGPSGQVIVPTGGTVYNAYYNIPSAKIHLTYRPVLQYNPPACRSFTCTSRTYFISATLTGSTTSYPLIGFLATPPLGNLDAYLTPPANVCGNFRLTIRESALFNGNRVEFQSAAPSITIRCTNAPPTKRRLSESEDSAALAIAKRGDGINDNVLVERDDRDTSLAIRQSPGPSGRLIEPAGGASISIDRGYPSASIHFIYSTVYQRVTGPCSYCTAETLFVEVRLVPTNGGPAIIVARNLAPESRGVNIDTWLGAPADACAEHRLEVYETQQLRGSIITFKSAAPAIYLNCVRLP